MASVISRPMTADEFYEWTHRPENRDRQFELEEGEVVEVSRPGERHGTVCSNTSYILVGYTRSIKQGNVTSNDTGIVLERGPDTVRGPDVAMYLENRKFKDLEVKYSERVPNLVVEILSPNDRRGKMQKRINKFLEKGVAMVWLLDPEEETVSIFVKNQLPIVLEGDEEVTGLDVFDGFRCKACDFFRTGGE